MDLLIGILGGLIVGSIWAILPSCHWLSKRCIESAVRQMPEKYREELREEWLAELDAFPGEIWGLFWAIDLIRGAEARASELGTTEQKWDASADKRREAADVDRCVSIISPAMKSRNKEALNSALLEHLIAMDPPRLVELNELLRGRFPPDRV